ncbi:hypothetical protein [Enterobacter cloacae]|uniref:hypothetical protein n=1 Tax=Enterobacter cloacae TaxID=550 RepID=UPI000507674C|nr:hypothetical protein [Enterobacter cloacae]KGB13239.1 putative orf-86 [Enterobacter cloacae]OOC83297.1 hypothetical protein BWP06_20160 [Enterobacter cloacae]QLA63914.1 hypothetical protein HWQ16_16710 [Enterobacter cloacae]QWZ87632.1 hypothetical protein I6L61_13250 [Enterobacter cloacae]CUI96397.1 Uncharacterised protein [Enterobacter cloacae]
MEESRKAFESWLENYHGIKASNSGHANMIEMYWQAWKASREAIEIKLPPKTESSPYEHYMPHYTMDADSVESAIRAAGIKVNE